MNRCDKPSPTSIGRRRGAIRRAAAARARRSVEAVVQPVNRIPVYALLAPDAEEAIHQTSMRILEEVGVDPNVAINVVCHAAFSRYFKDLMVGIAVLFNLTCGESEQQSKIDTRSCEIGDLPTIG